MEIDMKKILSCLLALALILAMCACNSQNANPDKGTDPNSLHGTENTSAATEPNNTEHIHQHQSSDTVGANCTEGGYTVYVCACGDSYHADETEALGHNYGEWITIKEPTEAEEGEAKRTCSVCNEAETRVLSKLIPDHTHEYTDEVTKAATCATEGIKSYTCSCGDTYTENTPKEAHNYNDSVTAATCTTGGYTTHTCTECGYAFADSRTDSTGHSWGAWENTKEPTTTSTGTAERRCALCNKKETKTLDKLVEGHTHNYSPATTKAATCTEDGIKTYSCSCGDKYTESISKLGHSYTSKVTSATCTTGGYTTHTCSRCKNTYKDTPVAALGHSWDSGEITTTPTCSQTGVKTFTCGNCKEIKTEILTKLAHNYTDSITDPTCTKQGYTTYTCSNCADSYRDTYTDATGHNYNSAVTKPTCTEDGYTTHTCSSCGDSYTDSKVSATGHGSTTTTTVEPTCTEDGYTVTSCVDCGAPLSTTVIASTGSHSYTVTMALDDAVQAEYDRGYTDYIAYAQHEDFDVKVCSGCGDIDIDTMQFRYSDAQASNIMMGYINEMREAEGIFPLELDTSLLATARTMMNEFTRDGYITTSTSATVWSVDGGYNIRHHFNKLKSLDYWLDYNYEYFAYVADIIHQYNSNALYGVALIK